MSTTKLTLKLDETAISRAKIVAKAQSTSLSKLVEGFFRQLAGPQIKKSRPIKLSPRVKRLMGIMKGPPIDKKEFRQILESELRAKHGLD